MDQGVACIECRGPVKELHFVGGELPSDVPSRGLVCLYRRQVSFHNACGPRKKRRKGGQKQIRNKRETKKEPVPPAG